MQIYTYEASFWRALLDNGGSLEMSSAFMKYINIFKDEWSILIYVGLLQMLVLFTISFFTRQKR
jgi:hypothetical protein